MRHVVVCGPPCAGKSTYVAEHKQDGDVVIDVDQMASALAGLDEVRHDLPDHYLRLAAAAHYRLRRLLRQMTDQPGTAWVIHANPSATEISVYRSWGWSVVAVDPGREVVEERCSRLRPAKATAWVDQWYTAHPEGVLRG